MEVYREYLWRAWITTPRPVMTDIPVNRAQLQGRSGDFEPTTAEWMTEHGTTWRAVRDAHTGHVIHCVSDRPWNALTDPLRFGLRIMCWMSPTPLTWYWWDNPWPRILPAGEQPGREHLNGGWATPGVPEVHVYRREEAHKVMIHEAIHALGMDVPIAMIPRHLFEADLGRQLWPHVGECYTELLAEWLWAIVQSRSLAGARRAWNAQMTCSARQAVEVWARTKDIHEPEDTNVFAYYILKWVLMNHLDEVLLNPKRTVNQWFVWWDALRPVLTQKALKIDINRSMRLGMTCGRDDADASSRQ